MYFPLSILELIHDRKRRASQRPATEADVSAAVTVARYTLARLGGDERGVLRRQAVALVATTLVPIAGHLLLDWPLALIGLAAIVDALTLVVVDAVRFHRRPGEVRAALHFAIQVEIVLDLAPTLASGSGAARVTNWRASDNGYMQFGGLLLAPPLLVGASLAHQLMQQAAWFAVAICMVMPVATRLYDAMTQPRGTTARGEPDLADLPQAPAALMLVGLAALLAGVVLAGLSLTGTDRWDGVAVLVAWIGVALLMSFRWLRSMERGRAALTALLESEPHARRYRLQSSFRPEDTGEREYVWQAMDPGSLWPPVWIGRPDTAASPPDQDRARADADDA